MKLKMKKEMNLLRFFSTSYCNGTPISVSGDEIRQFLFLNSSFSSNKSVNLRWGTETIEIKETLKEAYRPAVAEKKERGRGKRSTNRSNSRKSVMEKTVETPTARKKTECKGKATRKKKITNHHYSQFSLEGLDPAENLIELGCKLFPNLYFKEST
ncbi:hypothetical protein LXL04_011308 [Taraxacum kok-saghyz]